MTAAAMSIAASLIVWLLFGGGQPTPRSTDDALDAFRSSVTASPATPTSSAADGIAAPPPGVYPARGSGSEVTSFPPLVEQQGPEVVQTITPTTPGCWTVRVDFNTHHWQTWHQCLVDGGRRVEESGGSSFARRELGTLNVDNTSTFTCAPAKVILRSTMTPGETMSGGCTGTSDLIEGSTTNEGQTTYLGEEVLTIGGTAVHTWHLRQERVLAGAQTGTERSETWYRIEDALPVRNARNLAVDTATPFGDIHYTEDADYELTSLTPTT